NFSHSCFAIANGNDVDALIFQGQPHHLLDVAIVVRNQNSRHRTSSGVTLHALSTLIAQSSQIACSSVLEHSARCASIFSRLVCVGSEYPCFCPIQPEFPP